MDQPLSIIDPATMGPGPATLILVAYLGNPSNPVAVSELAEVMRIVTEGCGPSEFRIPDHDVPRPAVPIEESCTEEYLICLEDGEKLTMLKRYLRSQHNMSPEEYRAKWGLPADYPMVAPSYAARRSQLAKAQGLGRKPAPVLKVRGKRA